VTANLASTTTESTPTKSGYATYGKGTVRVKPSGLPDARRRQAAGWTSQSAALADL
jgi:hypothetical protein